MLQLFIIIIIILYILRIKKNIWDLFSANVFARLGLLDFPIVLWKDTNGNSNNLCSFSEKPQNTRSWCLVNKSNNYLANNGRGRRFIRSRFLSVTSLSLTVRTRNKVPADGPSVKNELRASMNLKTGGTTYFQWLSLSPFSLFAKKRLPTSIP